MSLAVAVMAYNRPRYLYVTLDGIFRNVGIEKYPVYVMVDGQNAAIGEAAAEFPVSGCVSRQRRVGGGKHYVSAVQCVLDFGYDYVMFVEADVLLRSDSMRWVAQADLPAIFTDHLLIGLSFSGGERSVRPYMGMASIAEKRSFRAVYEYVMAEKPCLDDGAINSYISANNKRLWSADKNYCGHFGIRGVTNRQLNPFYQQWEDKLFAGSQETWLDNAASLFFTDAADYIPDGCSRPRVRPKGFVYE